MICFKNNYCQLHFLEYFHLGIQMFLAQELELAAKLCMPLPSYTHSSYLTLGELFSSPTEKTGGQAILGIGRLLTEREGTSSPAGMQCLSAIKNVITKYVKVCFQINVLWNLHLPKADAKMFVFLERKKKHWNIQGEGNVQFSLIHSPF